MCLHDVTQESVATENDNFADAFVFENVSLGYDVTK